MVCASTGQVVGNDDISVFNVNCVDAFRWAVRLFKSVQKTVQ